MADEAPLDDDAGGDRSDLPLALLDDTGDREELRERYYGLLQEIRVVLPGVQVLLAFLLTTPFAARFSEIDQGERVGFGFALGGALLSVIFLVSPTVFHRVAGRRVRVRRLRWGINCTVIGLMLLGVSLLAAFWTVANFAFGSAIAAAMTVPMALVLAGLWVAVPRAWARQADGDVS